MTVPPVPVVPVSRVQVPARIVAGSLLAVFTVIVAVAAAWPIYRSGSFVLLATVGSALGAAIAALATRRRWSGWIVAAVVAVTILVAGVPLAVPARLGGVADVLRGLGDLASGLVFGWKDLLTVELPVGAYRNLLVPALVVFLGGTCALLLLAWRADRRAYAAVPVALGMVSFGLLFGRTTVSASIALGPLTLAAPVETACGAAALLGSLLWLAWRAHDERVRALRRAADSSGVRVSRRPTPADRRRIALGAGMIALALAAAVAVVPAAAHDAQRHVLRSSVGPEIDLSAQVSPLSQYRSLFSRSDPSRVLFTVDEVSGDLDRVRLAVLDEYDGEVFRAAGGGLGAGRFVRVPAALDPGQGAPVEARITIDGLEGVWMPTAGALAAVAFEGPRAASLADGFYYSAGASAGVQIAGDGVRAGDVYRLSAVVPAAAGLRAADAPGRSGSQTSIPDSLQTWVEQHAGGTGGLALADLVELLRARGYLSHALVEDAQTAVWMEPLGSYTFQPSASGHSLARIDSMFQRLLERETDPRAAAAGNLVAAIGDDEQFATAVALIARELGFPSRVVVGARLTSTDPDLATCRDGLCRAQDISAWVEVLSADGEWLAVDVTPQHEVSPSLDTTTQRDPENVTEVRPDTAERILPPVPLQEDSSPDDGLSEDAGLDLAWLWPVLRAAGIAGILLLLAFGPFLAVIAAKAARRRARRRAPTAAARIVGGWDELADAAADTGTRPPRAATRSEQAALIGGASASAVAALADRAAFAGPVAGLGDGDADECWRLVDDERRELRRAGGVWRAVRATVSLRSFLRPLAPAPSGSTRTAERRRRRAPEPARPAS